jgi:hypothetical protein
MEYNEKIHSKLAERKENSTMAIEREMEISGGKALFVGYGIEKVKEEEGIIKIEPSKASSTVFISRETALPLEVAINNNILGITNEQYMLRIEDSVEEGRVIKYQRDEGIKEIPINKNGEYEIEGGTLKVEDNGYKMTLSVSNTKLVVEGFKEARKLKYLETSGKRSEEEGYSFIVEIKSIKEVEALRRNEVLVEFQKVADEINGDKHGLAKGITRILNDNDVPVVYQ